MARLVRLAERKGKRDALLGTMPKRVKIRSQDMCKAVSVAAQRVGLPLQSGTLARFGSAPARQLSRDHKRACKELR